MYSALAAFIASFVVAILLTPLVSRLASGVGAVDKPDERHAHERAIPRLGGIGVAAAFFVPFVLLFVMDTGTARLFYSEPLRIVGLGVGGLMVCALGAADDVKGVVAWKKLLIQVAAATVAFFCGFRIEGIAIPGLGVLEMGVFALPITALWFVGIINAMNLIDGLDGLAAGIGFFACTVNLVVGLINQSALVMLLSASLAGGALGFLLYNFNPARIFLGDSGSMFIGFVLAATSLLGSMVKHSTAVAILVPVIALGVPIMDTLFSMVRRVLERRPIFSPDRGHIHHRLLEMGVTHRKAVLILYGFSIAFAAGAVVLATGRNWQIGVALTVMSLVAVGLFRAIRGVEQIRASRSLRLRHHAPSTERLRGVIPDALDRIRSTRSLGELREEIELFADRAKLASCEFSRGREEGAWTPLAPFAWNRGAEMEMENGSASRSDLHAVSVEYDLEKVGRAVLRFAWTNTYGDVSPQDEILLQLVADAFEARVVELGEAPDGVATGRLRPVD